MRQLVMMRDVNLWKSLLCGCLLTVGVASCSWIGDDLSDCPDPDTDFEIDYELRLVTNLITELNTELNTEADIVVAQALREHLSNIFTDYAHDVDLSFYDTASDSLRLHHDEHIMDANQASYVLNLPKRQYMHLAAANVMENNLVSIGGDDRCHRSSLQQTVRDTIDSHTTGVFTARAPMEVLEGVDQSFDVHLYIANCAAALVVDPRGHDTKGVRVFTTGFATSFSICDSVYHFSQKSPVVRTTQVTDETAGELSFCSVNFPSREPVADSAARTSTRMVIETTDPFVAEPDENALWRFLVYVPQPDGKVTESVLSIRQPLRAGQLRVIKCWLDDDGEVRTEDQTVAVSVTLDWKQGQNHHVPL